LKLRKCKISAKAALNVFGSKRNESLKGRTGMVLCEGKLCRAKEGLRLPSDVFLECSSRPIGKVAVVSVDYTKQWATFEIDWPIESFTGKIADFQKYFYEF